MQNWHDNVLRLIAEIDRCIRAHEGETLTLAHLARLLGYSQSQVSHQFHALTGTSLRDFVQARRPALSPPAVAAHGDSAAGLLSRRAGSRRHGKRCTDVFYHASCAQICTHSQL